MSKTQNIQLTQEIKDRIRTLIKEEKENANKDDKKERHSTKQVKHTDESIARAIGIDTYILKNIIKSTGNKSTTKENLHNIARYFNVSYDYLICESNNPHQKKDGHEVQSALDFTERDRKNNELSGYLRNAKNYKLLDDLHFLFYEGPKKFHVTMPEAANAIHALAEALRGNAAYREIHNLSLSTLESNLELLDDINHIKELRLFKKAMQTADYKEATIECLKLIKYSINCKPHLDHLTVMAVECISYRIYSYKIPIKELDSPFHKKADEICQKLKKDIDSPQKHEILMKSIPEYIKSLEELQKPGLKKETTGSIQDTSHPD